MLNTPRQKFSQSSFAPKFKDIVERNEAFEEATLAALLEFQTTLPLDTTQPQQACDAHQQMAGARKFLDILTTIYQPVKQTPLMTRGLDHTAGV